ncbi:adenosylcobalamin-dependent ribonucleoside-diphosphate reductase [Candidatus Woesearchaeota archaeon]|nr:adenosylcobalamin-dependent ribonucleoside-diphosphate reductase [Candidatus Woesearchaeota archaeon]
MPAYIKKRDGRIVRFDKEKIVSALSRAFIGVGERRGLLAKEIAGEVTSRLGRTTSVEHVQDVIEQILIRHKLAKVAKAYILYRKRREEERERTRALGVVDDLKLGANAIRVLQARYLLKDEKGHAIETPSQLFRRVAKAIAAPDMKWKQDARKAEEDFYHAMAGREFLPNTPTLMNAGTRLGQLAACFVLPVEDNLESIYETLKHSAMIHQSGGGTGFAFSRLRPKGDVVRSTHGVSSGPVSFMKIYDASTDIIKQGGKRRGANMGILRVDHPDILEFIRCKARGDTLRNFNISVGVTDDFMHAVENNSDYELVNPRTNRVVSRISARSVFDMIVTNAWETGDPGMVFLDEINRRQPTPSLGDIEATNPCGEIPLLPYEACNLGSINVGLLVHNKSLDWKRLKELVHLGVHFLDNVVEASNYPLEQINAITKRGNRKIGLGVMGFADMLVRMQIPYTSPKALALAQQIIVFIKREALKASMHLAESRGSFAHFAKSSLARKYRRLRNATVLAVAPTGTISIIAGCSSGIEPLFGVAFVRHVLEGAQLVEVNNDFETVAHENNFYSRALMLHIARTGSIRDVDVPAQLKKIFITAMDIHPLWHVHMQAAFQNQVDNAVSKTINLPHNASIADVARAYKLAHTLGCKGITIFRYGSKEEQVLYTGTTIERETGEEKPFLQEVSSCPACR